MRLVVAVAMLLTGRPDPAVGVGDRVGTDRGCAAATAVSPTWTVSPPYPPDGYVTPGAAGQLCAGQLLGHQQPGVRLLRWAGTSHRNRLRDIKCSGDMPGMDDVAFPGASHLRPGRLRRGFGEFQGTGLRVEPDVLQRLQRQPRRTAEQRKSRWARVRKFPT